MQSEFKPLSKPAHSEASSLALTLSRRAASRTAAGALPVGATRRAPIASIRLVRHPSLAALLNRFAIIVGVGAIQGATSTQAGVATAAIEEVAALQDGGGGPAGNDLAHCRSAESRQTVRTTAPPSPIVDDT